MTSIGFSSVSSTRYSNEKIGRQSSVIPNAPELEGAAEEHGYEEK